MTDDEIRTATVAQTTAHFDFIRDPSRTPRGFRNGLTISLAMWACVGLLGWALWSALAVANVDFAKADLRNQETRLAWVEAR